MYQRRNANFTSPKNLLHSSSVEDNSHEKVSLYKCNWVQNSESPNLEPESVFLVGDICYNISSHTTVAHKMQCNPHERYHLNILRGLVSTFNAISQLKVTIRFKSGSTNKNDKSDISY